MKNTQSKTAKVRQQKTASLLKEKQDLEQKKVELVKAKNKLQKRKYD